MRVNPKTFNVVVIVLGVLAVLLLPVWHIGPWGYAPSIAMLVLLVSMYMLRAAATN